MKTKRIKKKGGSATRSRSRSRERENSLEFHLNVKRDSMGKITSINIQDDTLRIILIVKRDNMDTRVDLFSFYNFTQRREKKRHLARAVLLKMLQYLLDNGIDEETTTYVNPEDAGNNDNLTRLQEEYIKMGFTNFVRRHFEVGCLEGTMLSNINALRENIKTHYNIHLNED
jgi:hypothetical protein